MPYSELVKPSIDVLSIHESLVSWILKFFNRSHYKPKIPIFHYSIIPLSLFLLFIISGCATLPQVDLKTFTEQEIHVILSRLDKQGAEVSTFYSVGTLSVKDGYWEQEANTLIIGTQKPLRIKVEVTHSWGPPILHILIYENKLRVLSFRENTFYTGKYTPRALSRFIPGDLDQELIWSALRGYPRHKDHHRTVAPDRNRIILLDQKGKEVEVVWVYEDDKRISQVLLREGQMDVTFSGFGESEGITFAGEVKVKNSNGDKNLFIKNNKMVFNQSIPEEIFILNKPPGYKTVYLEE